MIKFTQLTEKLKYPPKYRAELSELHSDVIVHGMKTFKNTSSFKRSVVNTINIISYHVISGDTMPDSWDRNAPITSIDSIDVDLYKDVIGDLYITPRDIEWDITESNADVESYYPQAKATKTSIPDRRSAELPPYIEPTPKDHLYIKPPLIPQFDVNKPWLDVVKNGNRYTIYCSLPIIPTIQNEISVTTDVSVMTNNDLIKLFPNHFIRTRSSAMYEVYDGLTFDKDLGTIFPIDRFTEQQIRDNIIKYPHLYKLMRLIDGKGVSFYSNIEIDGILYNTTDVWDSLPDSKKIPRNSEFIKEYVVRRYLLERDIKGINHKYPMFGTLEPFLTLFTTPSDYEKYGYSNAAELGKRCVQSRVSYLQSRNPVIRAVYSE